MPGHHDHSHAHAAHGHHDHHDHHHHPLPDSRKILLIAIVANLVFVFIEFSWGLAANSTALMADAGHNLSDVLGLVLALGAILLAKKQTWASYTYGLRSSSILAALVNAMLLLLACGAIGWEAAHRVLVPASVDGKTVVIVAALAIAVNGFSAWLLIANSKNDLNIRAAFLHMMLDAAVSLAVVIGGLMVMLTGWTWLDPVISTWGVLRDAMRLALSAVPSHIDLAGVQRFLLQQPGVSAIEDLHIWGMSTTETALTVHLIMPQGAPGDAFIHTLAQELKHDFAIHHSTVQIMSSPSHGACVLLTA